MISSSSVSQSSCFSLLVLLISSVETAAVAFVHNGGRRSLQLVHPFRLALSLSSGDASGSGTGSSNLVASRETQRRDMLQHSPTWLVNEWEKQQQQQEEETTKEWHESFSRNNLADFVPPDSSHLQCLLVGERELDHRRRRRHRHLPWEKEPQAQISFLLDHDHDSRSNQQLSGDGSVNDEDAYDDDIQAASATTCSSNDGRNNSYDLVSTEIATFLANHQNDDTGSQAMYDCIMDKGLMDALIMSNDGAAAGKEPVLELLQQASRTIREHGIYVSVTQELSSSMKDYLIQVGESVGMEWNFDLDGISQDGVSVSVARKYYCTELPHMGLATTTAPSTVNDENK